MTKDSKLYPISATLSNDHVNEYGLLLPVIDTWRCEVSSSVVSTTSSENDTMANVLSDDIDVRVYSGGMISHPDAS